ncbi:hypothetical protein ALI144C_31720 [Actinosynnema sp. ALI-1.44]|uniref:tetratricopeptide repeat protein n=1 Tax=Actinosynnema sp. ALI-1.44 TaxID=1933779 RepID=UPI00097BDFC5|nr:tetratricopeptide repeat protein [Actinosynnema sp. ALI-1.44]ONI77969.1 hypothetical protein ALI144C_31720 [Actinosynnema sp. ALI-1.44]
MDGLRGVRLAASIGATDRGTLWRASREREHDRIVRVIEPRFCDGRFRQALSTLRQRGHDRMLGVASEGWSDGRYYVEYSVHAAWRSLAEWLGKPADWWERLAVLGDVCEAVAHWQRSPLHPLGMTLHSVVVVGRPGEARTWLVPCPSMTVTSPCDLFGVDATVVATLAPETIRGAQFDDRAQDAYALGTLAAQVLGCQPARLAADDDEHQLEAQARGVLLRSTVIGSDIPEFLHATPQVERLFAAIRRYRHLKPDVRPRDAQELRSAIAAVTEPLWLAGQMRVAEPATAMRVLDQALTREPDRMDLRREWCLVAEGVLAQSTGRTADEIVERLLRYLKVAADPEDPGSWHRRAAEIHLRRGDWQSAATQFHAATVANPSDLDALLGYAQCWIGLDDPGNARHTAAEANRRIDRLARNQLLTKWEADQWRDRFAKYMR